MEYTKAVRDFRNENINKPQFQQKFNIFVQELFKPAIGKSLDNLWGFRGDKEGDSKAKLKRVQDIAGSKPTKIDTNTITEAEIIDTAKRKGMTVEQVKQRLGIK